MVAQVDIGNKGTPVLYCFYRTESCVLEVFSFSISMFLSPSPASGHSFFSVSPECAYDATFLQPRRSLFQPGATLRLGIDKHLTLGILSMD